jgi:hypothetical protein
MLGSKGRSVCRKPGLSLFYSEYSENIVSLSSMASAVTRSRYGGHAVWAEKAGCQVPQGPRRGHPTAAED